MCNNSKSDCSSASQSDSHQPMDQQQQQLYDHLLRTIAISVQAACMLVALLLAFLVFRYRKYKVIIIIIYQREHCVVVGKRGVNIMKKKFFFDLYGAHDSHHHHQIDHSS